jgi:hypothetical protein
VTDEQMDLICEKLSPIDIWGMMEDVGFDIGDDCPITHSQETGRVFSFKGYSYHGQNSEWGRVTSAEEHFSAILNGLSVVSRSGHAISRLSAFSVYKAAGHYGPPDPFRDAPGYSSSRAYVEAYERGVIRWPEITGDLKLHKDYAKIVGRLFPPTEICADDCTGEPPSAEEAICTVP